MTPHQEETFRLLNSASTSLRVALSRLARQVKADDGVPGPEATMLEIRAWAVERALLLEGDNRSRAATRLDVSERTLYRWLAPSEEEKEADLQEAVAALAEEGLSRNYECSDGGCDGHDRLDPEDRGHCFP